MCAYGSELHVTALTLTGLGGTLPSSLSVLTALQSLGLYDGTITGTVPSTLGACVQLQYLTLTGTQLSGTIPSSLGTLRGLK